MNTCDLFKRTVIPLVCKQMQISCFDEAIAIIDDFYRLNVDRNEQNGLKAKSDAWKALILEKQGKYSEALLLYQSAYLSLRQNDNFYVYNRLNIIRLLHKLKQDEEAIAQIETILKLELDVSVFELLVLLDCYVDCLESSNTVFPKRYLKFVVRIAQEFAPELDINLETQINLAIKQMVRQNRTENIAYSHLLIELDKVEKHDEQMYLLKSYLSNAKIDYYRQMAIAILNEKSS